MLFTIRGHDAQGRKGELFIDAVSEAEARHRAADYGMTTVTEVKEELPPISQVPRQAQKTPLPWFYGAADALLLLYVAFSLLGALLMVTAAESTQTTSVVAVVGLFFGLVFACLGQVLLDAGKHLRKIADRLPDEQK
jgi:hypothetical protein